MRYRKRQIGFHFLEFRFVWKIKIIFNTVVLKDFVSNLQDISSAHTKDLNCFKKQKETKTIEQRGLGQTTSKKHKKSWK